MEKKVFIEGHDAIAEAALLAGCRFFTGYPITPASEVLEYMASHMLDHGGTYIQAESELSAINMIFGAAAAGERAMTASSSPGIALMAETFGALVAAQLPAVIVNVCRGGPGNTGGYSQSDYFFHTKGGGHGDFHHLVLGPGSLQEAVDLTYEAFDLADEYRVPVVILADHFLAHSMESIKYPVPKTALAPNDWAANGAKGRSPNRIMISLWNHDEVERMTIERYQKYAQIAEKEMRYEAYRAEDCEVLLVAYGFVARIAKSVVDSAREVGMKVGLIRPITLYPFPYQVVGEAAAKSKAVLVVEANTGQMLEDVRLAVEGRAPVHFFGRYGGNSPSQKEIFNEIGKLLDMGGSNKK